MPAKGPVGTDVDIDQEVEDASSAPKGGLLASLDEQIDEHYTADGELRETPLSETKEVKEDPDKEVKEDPDKEVKEDPDKEVEKEDPDKKESKDEEDKPAEVKKLTVEELSDPDAAPVVAEEDSKEEEDEEVPADVKAAGDDAVESWKNLKAKAKELVVAQKEVAALKKQAEENKPVATEASEVEALRAKVKEQEDIIAVTHVEASEKYLEEVTTPLIALEERAKSLGGDKVMTALLTADPAQRYQALSDLSENMTAFQSSEMNLISREVETILKTRDLIRANAGDALKELQQSELATQGKETAERKAAREELTVKSWDHLEKQIPFMHDEKGILLADFAKSKEDVKQLNLAAEGTKESTRSYSAIAGAILPSVVNRANDIIAEKDAKIKEYSATIKELTKSGPGGGTDTGGDKVTTSDPNAGYLGSIEAEIAKGGVTFGGRR